MTSLWFFILLKLDGQKEFVKSRAMRANVIYMSTCLRGSVVYVPMCQKHANFSFLRASKRAKSCANLSNIPLMKYLAKFLDFIII